MNFSSSPLKIRLATWKDWDSAAYELGVCLGLWGDAGAPLWEDPWHGLKHIFWTANPLGEALHNMLLELVTAGVLEAQEDKLSFRWNPNYDANDVE
jgi:hypothetical protein